ncbi:MAG: Bax inhibitor-1/YccA family protein [Jatrophihabitantaceae bacterium]
MAENPVIRRFGAATGANVQTPSAIDLQKQYDQPAFTGPRPGQRFMTLDDVVQRTGAMLLVILAAGTVSWTLTGASLSAAGPLLLVGLMGGLGLGLYMSFSGRANAPLCILYSAFEGVLLGSISKIFEMRYPGIAVQAITGTVMVALGMLFVYKIGAIRVTPRLTRIVVGATIGVFGLMVVNLIAYLFTPGGLGLRDGGPLAIIFSLVCIGIAAMNLVIDFDVVERGIRNGADQKFAWYASFGITVTLVWLYIEILRLLSYLRD